jgi:phenylacetate-coenzyme A ligase PaaK-like adenylate-forming protein
MMKHLWAGNFIDDQELETSLTQLDSEAMANLALDFKLDHLFLACGKLLNELDRSNQLNDEIVLYLEVDNLKLKLERELNSTTPFDFIRPSLKDNIYEAYRPLGVLVHILPSNADSLVFLSALEGLLTGNINILKVGSKSGNAHYYMDLLRRLAEFDDSGIIAKMLYVVRLDSSQSNKINRILSVSDGVSVWGGDEAVGTISRQVAPGVRVVPWGHKISCAYVDKNLIEDEGCLGALATKIVELEQQACSSPQIIYVESDQFSDLTKMAKRLAPLLEQSSIKVPSPDLTLGEQAELKSATEMVSLEAMLGRERCVFESAQGSWRILVTSDSSFTPSPLFRTIWIKPLPLQHVIPTLFPVRRYLQSVGLAVELGRLASVVQTFVQAGVKRVTSVEGMLDSYLGAPHDGEYALSRYLNRVSVKLDLPELAGVSRLSDFDITSWGDSVRKNSSLMDKPAMQSLVGGDRTGMGTVFFKSGGSSGAPALSPFTYRDYHTQMRFAAEGLLAAGLDPSVDRAMNLFFGGALYGGFLSFFSILEQLKCTQFPMAAVNDFGMVANTIVEHRTDTLLGMPTYIIQLFQHSSEQLAQYRGVKKIFFGGEHMGRQQMSWLKEEFGVEVVRAAAYGSVDAGPLGYQCTDSLPGVYHLHQDLHHLELIQLESDHAVIEPNQVGRLVFSTPSRESVKLNRYLIGDLGHWLPSLCSCGRAGKRFKLLGREGDIFKVGGTFLNYGRFFDILEDGSSTAVEVQLQIDRVNLVDRLTLRYSGALSEERVIEMISAEYHDLHQAWVDEQGMQFKVKSLPSDKLTRTKVGKLIKIVDQRGSDE